MSLLLGKNLGILALSSMHNFFRETGMESISLALHLKIVQIVTTVKQNVKYKRIYEQNQASRWVEYLNKILHMYEL